MRCAAGRRRPTWNASAWSGAAPRTSGENFEEKTHRDSGPSARQASSLVTQTLSRAMISCPLGAGLIDGLPAASPLSRPCQNAGRLSARSVTAAIANHS